MNVGLIIAVAILVLYTVLGPIVLLGYYAFFDAMAEKPDENGLRDNIKHDDPDLWNMADVRKYLKQQRQSIAFTGIPL